MRCAAVIYLIRYILQINCDCLNHDKGVYDACPFRGLSPWTKTLERIMDINDWNGLRNIALIYASTLHYIQTNCYRDLEDGTVELVVRI